MSPRSASHIGPDEPRGSKTRLTNTVVNIRSTSDIVPSMGSIVSVMTSTWLAKPALVQSAKPGNARMYE